MSATPPPSVISGSNGTAPANHLPTTAAIPAAAISYLELGWLVAWMHACPAGHCSCARKGQQRRLGQTLNWGRFPPHARIMVGAHWREHPTDNLGIVADKQSGLAILEVPSPAELAELEGPLGPLPRTPVIGHRTKGFSYLFRRPSLAGPLPSSAGHQGSMVSVVGDNGVVAAPPSVADGEPFYWEVDPVSVPVAALPPNWVAWAWPAEDAPSTPPPTRIWAPPRPPLPVAPAPSAPPAEAPPVVLLSDIAERPIDWLLVPWVPRGMVTALAGETAVGKSTFQAHLASVAKRPILMPGEEDVARAIVPRMKANGVDCRAVAVIRPSQDWELPFARGRLLKAIAAHGADLVLLDPIDDYLATGFSDCDYSAVRALLQGLRQVAESTGAAIVITRNSGKDRNNVMVGSRAWGTVPRSIVELLKDPGPPPRRIIRPFKDSMGQDAPARYFDLVGEKGAPKTWRWGDEVAAGVVELAKEEPDRIERLKIDQAEQLLLAVLATGEMESADVYRAAEREGIKDRTLRRAAERLGVQLRREGTRQEHRCYWSLPAVANPEGGADRGMAGLPE